MAPSATATVGPLAPPPFGQIWKRRGPSDEEAKLAAFCDVADAIVHHPRPAMALVVGVSSREEGVVDHVIDYDFWRLGEEELQRQPPPSYAKEREGAPAPADELERLLWCSERWLNADLFWRGGVALPARVATLPLLGTLSYPDLKQAQSALSVERFAAGEVLVENGAVPGRVLKGLTSRSSSPNMASRLSRLKKERERKGRSASDRYCSLLIIPLRGTD